MNKPMMRLAIFSILLGCDKPTATTGREEAGVVAIDCVAAMAACEDWTPIHMADKRGPAPLEDCEGSVSRYDCKARNSERRRLNWEIEEAPVWRSPCQQQIEACVSLVDALVGAPATVHHHSHK